MIAESVNLHTTEKVHKIQADILWTTAQPLERAIALPQDAYTSQEFYAWEVDQIFKKQWVCVGHVSQLRQPGDYIRLDLFGEPLLITRDKRNEINVLSRVCPHRGMDLLPLHDEQPQQGNARNFVCPYHGWNYAIDGLLVSAAEMQRHEQWDRSAMCLHKSRTEIWQGFIFLNFESDVEPVEKQYQELQSFIDRWQIGQMEVATEFVFDCGFNWKVFVENCIEGYHHLGVHQKTLEPMIPALGTWTEREKPNYIVCHLPFAKHLVEHIKEGNSMTVFEPPRGLNKIDAFEYTVYWGAPSFLLMVGPDRVYSYVLQPQAADRLTIKASMLLTPASKRHPDYPKMLHQEAAAFKRILEEDIEVCTALQGGLASQYYKPGPLSHLEMPVWLFHRYLARQIHESIDAY
jgi:phenylpropionate dioxygenase-like ring-hydroxylating dioxygenase large terminal subunit